MRLIEPCCAPKHVRELRDAIGKKGKSEIEGYEDLSLTELLPALLTRYAETEMLIAAPTLPDQAAEIIEKWMKKQWARMNGKGKIDVVSRMTIVADLSSEQSPMASEWLEKNPFGDRLTLVNHAQPNTALLLPDLAITGPVNLRYGRHFTATATAVQEEIDALWKRFTVMGRTAEPTAETESHATKEEAKPEPKAPAK